MALDPKKLKSYLEASKQKKMAGMPNVIKKGMPGSGMAANPKSLEKDEHAKMAMKDAHKGGIASPMPPAKGKGPAKDAESAMKAMAKLIAEEIEEGEFDDDIMLLMEDFNPDMIPAWAEDKKTWKKAKKIVDPEGDGAEYSDPYAVVAHLYKKMGGKCKDMPEHDDDDDDMDDDLGDNGEYSYNSEDEEA